MFQTVCNPNQAKVKWGYSTNTIISPSPPVKSIAPGQKPFSRRLRTPTSLGIQDHVHREVLSTDATPRCPAYTALSMSLRAWLRVDALRNKTKKNELCALGAIA